MQVDKPLEEHTQSRIEKLEGHMSYDLTADFYSPIRAVHGAQVEHDRERDEAVGHRFETEAENEAYVTARAERQSKEYDAGIEAQKGPRNRGERRAREKEELVKQALEDRKKNLMDAEWRQRLMEDGDGSGKVPKSTAAPKRMTREQTKEQILHELAAEPTIETMQKVIGHILNEQYIMQDRLSAVQRKVANANNPLFKQDQ